MSQEDATFAEEIQDLSAFALPTIATPQVVRSGTPVVADARGNSMFADFLRRHSCYDLLPISGKVVVLDASLLVKKAFYALQQNGSLSSSHYFIVFPSLLNECHVDIRSAPVWDSERQAFVGMLTVTDFIKVILHYRNAGKEFSEFETQKICDWQSTFILSAD